MADEDHHIQVVETDEGRFHAACTCGWTSRDVMTREVAAFHAARHVDATA